MHRAEDIKALQERMKRFGLAIIRMTMSLPDSRATRILSSQVVDSATSSGANYRAACRARSKAEFIAKMGIVEEELDETLYWLEVLQEASFISEQKAEPLHKEANELLSIVVASIQTARKSASR